MYTRTAPVQAELGRETQMGGWFDSLTNILKTGSDAYQAHKSAEAAKTAATSPVIVPQQSFMQKHGGKILLGGVALGAFLLIRRMRK